MSDLVEVGSYVVIQKQSYKKLFKLTKPDSCINVGRDTINLSGIVGCKYHSVFKMIAHNAGKKSREYKLEFTDEAIDLADEIDVKVSGADNRNIIDDGQSQKLSAGDIEELKGGSNKAADIVETLISNSNTFHNKTEFSQEKYLKKKEKKYFEYIKVLKPNLRTISEIMYKLEPIKIQCIRVDTLSQIVSLANVYSDGNYLLYDSGSSGLVAAALLSCIGENSKGRLVHMHPGNMSQKQALLAMNFKEEQFNRCISVNVYSVLRQIYQGCDTNSTSESCGTKRTASEDNYSKCKIQKVSNTKSIDKINGESQTEENVPVQTEGKKPKWHFDNITASELLNEKVDALVIACKEDPKSFFNELVQFVKPGRPFVVYFSVAEPLQHLYLALKCKSNIAALKLTCNWMRNYQILSDRTHPEVTMNGSSGFLLSGYVLK